MSSRRLRVKTPRTQRGNASVEWTLITFALLAALFVPYDGQQSVATMFMEAVRDFYANSSFPLSLP